MLDKNQNHLEDFVKEIDESNAFSATLLSNLALDKKTRTEEEKINQGKVLNVGNTIVDVIAKYKKKSNNNDLD